MIFDATDAFTPVGDLPDTLEGSLALIIAGEDGGLQRMPVTPSENNLLERTISVNLSSNGEINGTISERAQGQASTSFRQEYRSTSAADYRKAIEGWLSYGATGSKLESLKAGDGPNETTFDLEMSFSASRYAQEMQNRLLVFKPVIVGRRNAIYLTEAKRVTPIEIEAFSMKETVEFKLPPGYIVDEVPTAMNLSTNFGKYSTNYEVTSDKLVFSRSFSLDRTIVPVEKYPEVKDFFVKMREAEQSPVVLIKK